MLMVIETFYKEHEGLIQIGVLTFSIIFGYIAIVQPIISFIITQRNANRDKRYKIYHDLITTIAGGDGTVKVKLFRQVSSIYELRNFPEYFPVSKRILIGMKKETIVSDREDVKRLVEEINLTINYIDTPWIKRKFYFNRKHQIN